MRGQFVAQSNPAIPQERAFLNDWFQSADSAELEGFFSIFPALTQMANYSLYDTSFSRGQVTNYNTRLLLSLIMLNDWAEQAGSPKKKEQLQSAIKRIELASR